MPQPALTPVAVALALLLGLLALGAAAAIYARVGATLRAQGGAVHTAGFALPDLLVSLVLASTLAGLSLKAALRESTAPALKAEQILPSSLIFVVLVAGVIGFLRYRGVRVAALFGLRRLGPVHVLGWAAVLLCAALPFIGLVNLAVAALHHGPPVHQALVDLFREAAAKGEIRAVLLIALTGVLVAPVCEEILFRGYFYPVTKQHLGARGGGLLTAALFAAVHGNLAALPGLFVLALALTVAYERTGSLFTCMAMHALFNATSLAALYLTATGRLPA